MDQDKLNHVLTAKPQERRIKVALVNAFGFGSNNSSLVLKRFD